MDDEDDTGVDDTDENDGTGSRWSNRLIPSCNSLE